MPDQPASTDWWDRLYDSAATDTASATVPNRPRIADRLPDWWTGDDALNEPELVADDVDADVDHDFAEPEEDDEPQREHHGADERSRPSRWSSWGGDRDRVGMTLNPRARRLAYNGSAAGLGWLFGLVPEIRSAIESCGDEYGIGAALVLGAGIFLAAVLVIDRRTRGWWPPLAWVCRAPAASALLAICLYTPAA